jgi:hypothetical protein
MLNHFINHYLKGQASQGVALEVLTLFYQKREQLLISLIFIDFSFIMEENISEILLCFTNLNLSKFNSKLGY